MKSRNHLLLSPYILNLFVRPLSLSESFFLSAGACDFPRNVIVIPSASFFLKATSQKPPSPNSRRLATVACFVGVYGKSLSLQQFSLFVILFVVGSFS